MHDEIDPELLNRFAQSNEPLPSAGFLEAFWAKLEHARRMRTLRRIALIVGIAVLGAWATPRLLHDTAAAVQAAAEYAQPLPTLGALVVSPLGWAASTLIGLIVLIRVGALRRR